MHADIAAAVDLRFDRGWLNASIGYTRHFDGKDLT